MALSLPTVSVDLIACSIFGDSVMIDPLVDQYSSLFPSTSRSIAITKTRNSGESKQSYALILLITMSFVVLCAEIRTSIFLIMLVLYSVTCSSRFIPTQISLGSRHTCALSAVNKAMKCWGWNSNGELGYGDKNFRGDGPGEMGGYLNVVNLGTGFIPIQMSTGAYHTCALSQSNLVKCWGFNDYGELGYGDVNDRGDGPDG